MTTVRINQVTAFSLRPRAQARSSRTRHGTGYGTCLSRPNATALVTARGLDFARSITLPFPIPSRKHPPLLGRPVGLCQGAHTHTHTATASTSSSLGSLVDPGGSRTGCIQLFSQRHREITGATPLATMPRTGPIGTRDVSRSMRAAMGQSQSAPVVSPCHPRWCGQRLAKPPARCLPGSRPSGSITMLMWPGVSLPCHAR